jgi:hypothetical protein
MRSGPSPSAGCLGSTTCVDGGHTRVMLLVGIALLSLNGLVAGQLMGSPRAYAGGSAVALGSAGSYSVLGATGVTSTGVSDLSGDVGVSPASSIVGFPPGIVGGHIHAGDLPAAQAQGDLQLAYNDASGRTPNSSFAGDLNGQIFTPGVYDTAVALALTGTLTLDGQGDPNAVFVFQVDAALNTAAASTVSLINGARASNVFWQVKRAAGIGADASFSGTIMAAGAVTVGAGADLTGGALSTSGTVTLATNTITTPDGSGGTLSMTAPSGSLNLGTYAVPESGRSIAGLLGTVEVTDTRGGSSDAGWVVTVGATAFSPASGPAPGGIAVSYSAGPISQVRGASTLIDDHPNNVTVPVPAVTATGTSGDNEATTTWNPTVSVTVPGGLFAGAYTSTITQTVV